MKVKSALCTSNVPAVLTSDRQAIEAGTRIEYTKIIFRNGEHHLVLADKKTVPAVFFDF